MPLPPIAPIVLSDLTTAQVAGTGVFDVLMQANKAHLEAEFNKNRIKGSEYATVYLGSLQHVLAASVQFLLEKDKRALDAALVEQQILLAQKEVEKADKQLLLVDKEIEKATAELAILEAQVLKVPAEIAHLEAQTDLVGQQLLNLVAEADNIPKQGVVLDKQAAHLTQQTTNLVAEELHIDAQAAHVEQQTANLLSQKLHVEAQTELVAQQEANALTENTVLVAQECKLRAEFDVLMETKLKTAQETGLLAQKVATERAQTQAIGVDENSVVGRQKLLYGAQTDGFKRDAEQKAAKVLIDTWNVRRTTDEATVADGVNKLHDTTIGRAVDKLLTGVGA
jgi:hypothetical protein